MIAIKVVFCSSFISATDPRKVSNNSAFMAFGYGGELKSAPSFFGVGWVGWLLALV